MSRKYKGGNAGIVSVSKEKSTTSATAQPELNLASAPVSVVENKPKGTATLENPDFNEPEKAQEPVAQAEPEEVDHEKIREAIIADFNKKQSLDEGEADEKPEDKNKSGEVQNTATETEKPSETVQKDDKVSSTVISEELLVRAIESGMTVSEAKGFSPESLEKTLNLLEKRKTPEDKVPEVKEEEFKLNINEDDYDEATNKVFKAMEAEQNRLRKEIAKLTAKQEEVDGGLKTQSREQKQQAFFNAFDKTLDSLPEAESALFGKGTGESLGKETEQYKNRIALLEEIDIIAGGYVGKGMAVPEVQVLVDKAKKSIFADKLKEIAIKELTDKVDKRTKNFLLRPSSSQTETAKKDPRSAAVEEISNMVKEFRK